MSMKIAAMLPNAGNSKQGAGNLMTAAPSGPFGSARTRKSGLLSTASSRSAYHSIATAERTLWNVRVAPRADITLSSQEGMFGEGQLPVTQDDITALEVLRVDGLLLGLRLSMPGAYGVITS
jgi:hypothetical protein